MGCSLWIGVSLNNIYLYTWVDGLCTQTHFNQMRNLITNWRLDSWPLLIPMKDSSIFWLDYSVSIHFSLPRNFKRRQRCFFLSRSCYLKQPEKHQENFGKYFFPGRILHSSTQYVCQRLINIDLILMAPAVIFPQSMSLFHEKKHTYKWCWFLYWNTAQTSRTDFVSSTRNSVDEDV